MSSTERYIRTQDYKLDESYSRPGGYLEDYIASKDEQSINQPLARFTMRFDVDIFVNLATRGIVGIYPRLFEIYRCVTSPSIEECLKRMSSQLLHQARKKDLMETHREKLAIAKKLRAELEKKGETYYGIIGIPEGREDEYLVEIDGKKYVDKNL